jgi:hypothetical protein
MRRRWSQEELEFIERIAGDIPYHIIVRTYNNWAGKNGYPQRTMDGIKAICLKHGISLRPQGRWVTTMYIAEVLDIPFQTVTGWTAAGYLPRCTRARRLYVHRSSIHELAASRPHLFAGISADRVYALIEDEDLAQQIARDYPRNRFRHKGVRAVEKNAVYPSLRVAAKSLPAAHTSIMRAIHTGQPFAGYHWEYVA